MTSSDQYSDEPLPSGKKRCSQCGKVTSTIERMCERCLEKYSIQTEDPIFSTRPNKSLEQQKTSPGRAVVWLLFFVIGMAMSGVLAWAAPGVLVLLLVMGLPVFVRLTNKAALKREPSFVRWIGLSLLVGIASMFACCSGFSAICTGSAGLEGHGLDTSVAILLVALGGAGMFAALLNLFDR